MELSGDLGPSVGEAGRRSAGRAASWPSRRPIDLDANANAAALPEVIDAVTEALRRGAGNPSSPHWRGERSRATIARARDVVSGAVRGSDEDGVTFTSGCTEANNAVLLSSWGGRAPNVVTTTVEHSSVLRPAHVAGGRGGRSLLVPVDADGRVDPDRVAAILDTLEGPTVLSVQHANGETGVVQPIAEIAAVVAGRDDVLFHSDSAQSFGRIPVGVGRPSAPDAISLSGHKLHAPMGIGALVLAPEEARVGPLLHGGGQEGGLRAGTQSVPLVAGLAAACAARWADLDAAVAAMRRMRDRLERGVIERVPWATVNGAGAERLPNTSNIRFTGIDGMAMAARLDAASVACSLGSACESRRPDPSHVLLAMGLSRDDAFASLRFSVSPLNSQDEIDAAVEIIADIAGRLGTRR